jgi:ATP-dependent protease HslVU (ClpYQ) ATPase subunit
LLEEELFRMPDKGLKKLEVTAAMVRKRLADAIEDVDLSRYIL